MGWLAAGLVCRAERGPRHEGSNALRLWRLSVISPLRLPSKNFNTSSGLPPSVSVTPPLRFGPRLGPGALPRSILYRPTHIRGTASDRRAGSAQQQPPTAAPPPTEPRLRRRTSVSLAWLQPLKGRAQHLSAMLLPHSGAARRPTQAGPPKLAHHLGRCRPLPPTTAGRHGVRNQPGEPHPHEAGV